MPGPLDPLGRLSDRTTPVVTPPTATVARPRSHLWTELHTPGAPPSQAQAIWERVKPGTWAGVASRLLPPPAGAVWATVTPSEPTDVGKAFVEFDMAYYYGMDRVLMMSNHSDCITAYLTPLFTGRRFVLDFTLRVRATTSDPNQLSQCQLYYDHSRMGAGEYQSRPVVFSSPQAHTETLSIVIDPGPGTVASDHNGRVWHEGQFDLEFIGCKVTVL